MAERETVEFKVEGYAKLFEAYVEQTFEERRAIENKAAELCGGGIELSNRKAKYIELSKKKKKKQGKTPTPKNAIEAFVLNDTQNVLNDIYQYATLSVVLINPPIQVADLSEKELNKIYRAFEVALNPFREKEVEA